MKRKELDLQTKKDLLELLKLRRAAPDSDRTFIAYKYVERLYRQSPMNFGVIRYRLGRIVVIPRWKCDWNESETCGSGINVATRSWARRRARSLDYIVISLRVRVRDIVAIPWGRECDGKFRVCRAVVLT